MENSNSSKTAFYKLTNLPHTDILPHLPYPSIPVDVCDEGGITGKFNQEEVPGNIALVSQLTRLLQAADVSNISLRDNSRSHAISNDPLLQQLLLRNPHIFDCPSVAPRPLSLPKLLPATSQPLQSPFHSANIQPTVANGKQSTEEHQEQGDIEEQVVTVAPHPKRRRTTKQQGPKHVPDAPSSVDVAKELEKAVRAFLARESQSAEENGATEERMLSDSNNEHEEEGQMLKHLRRLSTVLLNGHAAAVMHLLPLEYHLQLLKALSGYILQGRDKVLHPVEEDSSEDATAISMATEASAACLFVLTSPDMPKQVYQEDLIEAIMDGVKFNLLSNVLSFYDARLCATHRPQMAAQADDDGRSSAKKSKSASKSASKVSKKTSIRIPAAVGVLAGRMESVLELLGKLLGVVQLQASMVLPLLRTAFQILTVEDLHVLQIKAVGLLVAGFKRFQEQRQTLVDHLVTDVLPNLPTNACPRRFVIGENTDAAILVVSALILQFLQASVGLPSLDIGAGILRDCYAPAMHWADVFWLTCLSKLTGARVRKADGDTDIKHMVEQVVVDVLLVHCAPEWPAALPALLRLIAALAGKAGLHAPDNAVRQIAVELLGLVAGQLCYEAQCAAIDAPAVEQILQKAGPAEGDADPVKQLLLSYLADQRQGDTELCESAREFLLCQGFADEITKLQRAGASDEDQVAALVRYRETCDILKRGASSGLTPEEAGMLARTVVHAGPLGKGRAPLLKRLADAADPTRQTPGTRAKAIKAVTTVVKADASVLGLPEVQQCINRALKDDAPSVRQAAVDLLGGHIGSRMDLAAAYFDTLITASRDTSTSVRKAAVRILWESCIRAPDFPRASEACVAVLHRVADNEESILELVAKVFHGLWFAGAQDRSGPGAAARAQQLADVSLFVYEAGGSTIHLPLDSSHAMVAVLKKALEREGKERPGKEWVAGRELACALLEGLLKVGEGEESDGVELRTFPYLVGLHALCLTDVSLCTPAVDPPKYIRCLAPYLKVTPSGKSGQSPQKQAAERREAECLLCILAVVDSILAEVAHINKALVTELQNDLFVLISKHPFIQVVSAACKTLATLAKHAPSAGSLMTGLAQHCLSILQEKKPPGTNPAICSRFLFVLGQLLRYGMSAIEETQLSNGKTVTLLDCQATCLLYFKSSADLKVRESALQALGCLGIARPDTLLASEAQAIMKAALQPSAPTILKTRALNNLTELLKAEEERLTTAQLASDEKQKMGRLAAGEAAAPLPTQNGEGDSLSINSGILQIHWDLVLGLATDATPPQTSVRPGAPGAAGQGDPGDPLNASVRRHAVAVMDAVDRNGLVAPWTAIPHLLALTTDPNSEVSARALRILRRVAEKQPEMFQTCLASGLKVTADFHERLRSSYHASTSASTAGVSEEVVQGLGAFYMELVQPNRSHRTTFLANVLRPFDAACNLHSPAAATSNLRLLALCAHLAAVLPYKRADEPLVVVHHINLVVSRRGEDVLSALKASLTDSSAATGGDVQTECRASLALSMLLLLKQHLKSVHGLTTDRIANFNPGSSETRKQEESKNLGQVAVPALSLEQLHLDAASDTALMQEQCMVLKSLMRADSNDYGDGITLGRRKSSKAIRAAEAEVEEEGDGDADRGDGPTPACTNFCGGGRSVPAQASGGPFTAGTEVKRVSRGSRGRGARSASRLGSDARCTVKGRGGGSTGGKSGRRKAARVQMSSDEDVSGGDDGDDGEEYVAPGRAAARRRLEPMLTD